MTGKLTKLDAVNSMLDAIGEDAVNSLSSGLADAELAERKLDEISRMIQSRGWDCNTSYELLLTRDGDNKIVLPQNYLKVDTAGVDEHRRIATRGQYLYDLELNTLTFTKDIYVDLVQFLEFVDLPFELQNYILASAGRLFQENAIGSVALDGFTSRREAQAKADWEGSSSDTEDANIIRQSSSVAVIAYRRNRIAGA